MPSPKKERKPDPSRRSVRPGDSLYFNGAEGVGHGKVVCHGQHGATLDVDGKPVKVRWQQVLGHRERVSYPATVVDHGEDGAIVEEGDGTRSYIEGLRAESEPEPGPEPTDPPAWESLLKKSLAPAEPAQEPRVLFFFLPCVS